MSHPGNTVRHLFGYCIWKCGISSLNGSFIGNIIINHRTIKFLAYPISNKPLRYPQPARPVTYSTNIDENHLFKLELRISQNCHPTRTFPQGRHVSCSFRVFLVTGCFTIVARIHLPTGRPKGLITTWLCHIFSTTLWILRRIKRGLLENPPFRSMIVLAINLHIVDFPYDFPMTFAAWRFHEVS